MSAPERAGAPHFARPGHGVVPREVELSTEVLEYLDRYAEHRCPELAGCLLEELAVRSQAADCELERCTCFELLGHWFGIDRRRPGRGRAVVNGSRTATMLGVHALIFAVALASAARLDAAEPAIAATGAPTQRVVSIGGALTEIVYELGAQEALVGVDTTSLVPEATTELPQVGYQRALSAEGILSLGPTVLLVTDDAGPPEVLDQVRAAGIDIDRLPSEHTLEAVLERVDRLAARFDRETEGEALSQRIRARMDEARAIAETLDPSPRTVFLLGTGAGSAMAAGADTAADAMLRYAGAENAFTDFDGYKPVGAEGLIGAAPDAIVVVVHDGSGDSGEEDIVSDALAVPGVAQTPAGRNGRIVVADALSLLGFGPRIGDAVHELAVRLRDGAGASNAAAAGEPAPQ